MKRKKRKPSKTQSRQKRKGDRGQREAPPVAVASGGPGGPNESQPSSAIVRSLMGNAFSAFQAGRFDEAVNFCHTILNSDPNHPEALQFGGLAAFQLGDQERAIEMLQAAAVAKPDFADAHFNLGAVLLSTRQPREAAAAFERAVQIQPDDAGYLNALGGALYSLGRLGEALAAHQKAAERSPRFADAHVCMGIVLKALGKPSEAEAAYRAALAIDPTNATTNLNLGNVLKALGKLEEAASAYRTAISAQPAMADAYQYLVSLKSYEAVDDDVRAMEGLLSGLPLGDTGTMHLRFGLAKIYDDLGDHDQAFAHLREANRLKRSSFDYDIAKDEERVERIKAVFGPSLMASRENQGCPSDIPIFIVGMPRSGTTLVEQILASHSHVFGGDELAEMNSIVERLVERSRNGLEFPEAVPELDSETLSAFGRRYVDAVRALAPDSPRITDKYPLNFWRVGLIRLILPQAKIINCVRDPKDTCFSCYQQLFVGALDFSYSLEELGFYHRLYDRLMAHWHEVLPGAILDVHYERLVADQDPETRRIIDFCELDWEDGCLAFHETRRPVFTLSSTDVRRPIYKSAIGRWKPYESQLAPLLTSLQTGSG